MKVDFVIAGAQKSGTTALDGYLRSHPALCMGDRKEVHFFDHDEYFVRSTPDYGSYHAHFSPRPEHRLVGEATPAYLYWPEAPRRIQQYNPLMKLVVVLRNPVDRAYSHWNMQRDRGIDPYPFPEALRREKERCTTPLQRRRFSYLDRGYYSVQLQRLWDHFPREQVHVLRYEHLRFNAAEAVGDVCRFLGIAALPDLREQILHARPYAVPMAPEDRDYLRAAFADDVRKLEGLVGWDCSDWLAD